VLTGSYDNTARLWDAQSGKELRTFEHPHLVHSVAFSTDGKQVLTGRGDKPARLWNAQSCKELRTLPHCQVPGIILAIQDVEGKIWSARLYNAGKPSKARFLSPDRPWPLR
jgi:WD40 repeat protein